MWKNITQSKLFWPTLICCWGVSVFGGWVWSSDYEFSTYETSERFDLDHWPSDTMLRLADDRPTLVFFMHPRCPCTRASIHELERLLTGRGLSQSQQPRLLVLATVPSDASAEWRQTDTVEMVKQLPLAELDWDVEGVETNHFGVTTSGTVMLYSSSGRRLFAGGVTASRGHEGGNAGTDRLHALLAQREQSPQPTTPSFGCKLCLSALAGDSQQTCQQRLGDSDNELGRGLP